MEKDRKSRRANELLRYEREKRGWSQSKLAELIGADSTMISRWETGERKPDHSYQEQLCTLFKKDAVELGFIEQQVASEFPLTNMRSSSFPFSNTSTNLAPQLSSNVPVSIIVVDRGGNIQNATAIQQAIELGNLDMDRRDFFRESFNATRIASGVALFSATGTSDELLERFLRAIQKPSTIDIPTLNYLEKRTTTYWQDRHTAVLASNDLLGYVLEHFHRVTTFLENPLTPTMRTRLCSDASEIAQLAGHLLFDIGDFIKSRSYHKAAIAAAQEANNSALQATAWARMSFTWTYSEEPQEALRCIQIARQLASNTNVTVQAYLAAVEAEIQAIIGNDQACYKALGDAEKFEEHQYSNQESYWLHFDYSRFVGYKGSCFHRLYHSKNNQDKSLLEGAQGALIDALERLSPTKIQRRPILLLDLANIYAKQGAIDEAYSYADQAMSITTQLRSKTVQQRLFSLQKELSPWKDVHCVRNLNSQISSLLIPSERRD